MRRNAPSTLSHLVRLCEEAGRRGADGAAVDRDDRVWYVLVSFFLSSDPNRFVTETGDIDEPGTLQDDLLTLLKV